MWTILIKVQLKRVHETWFVSAAFIFTPRHALNLTVSRLRRRVLLFALSRDARSLQFAAPYSRNAVFTRHIIIIGTRWPARNYRTEPFFARFTRNTVQYTYRFSLPPIDKQK